MIKNKSNSRHYKIDLKEYSDGSQALYELLASESEDLNMIDQQIHKNEFYRWLHEEGSPFSIAKNKLIQKELLLLETWTLQIPSQLGLRIKKQCRPNLAINPKNHPPSFYTAST